jgi:general secretion pathway protein A
VQIVLCGQPSLLATLAEEPMHALNERITRRVVLAPLAPEEVDAYIQHRLAVAGGAEAVRFDATATRVVAELAHGLPRRINVLCDRSLQEGRIEGVKVITGDLVKRAARSLAGAQDPRPVAAFAAPASAGPVLDSPVTGDLTFGQPTDEPTHSRRGMWVAVGGVLLAGALGAAYLYYSDSLLREMANTPPAPAGPQLDLGEPAGPLPVPSYTAPPDPPAAVAPVSRAPSGQLPDNPDQLN